LLRLRQQELAKRRALELEDQLNANAIAIRFAQDEDVYSEASSEPDQETELETEEGAVGGHHQREKALHVAGPQPVQ